MTKLDETKMKKAFDAFMKNPAWKRQYDNAPSEECKEYFRNDYFYSKYYDPDDKDAEDIIRIIKEQEKDLSVGDWEYIKSWAGNSPFVGYCNQKIQELSK